MKRIIVLLVSLCSGLIIAGCAHKAFVSPDGMRSSTHQVLIAGATEEVFKNIDFAELQGKKVYLEVHALAHREGAFSPEESYIASHLRNELLKIGGVVVQEEEQAEIAMVVNATAGTDFYHRKIIHELIAFTDLTKGTVSYKTVIYQLPEKRILSMKEGQSEEEYKETFILGGIIGPFH